LPTIGECRNAQPTGQLRRPGRRVVWAELGDLPALDLRVEVREVENRVDRPRVLPRTTHSRNEIFRVRREYGDVCDDLDEPVPLEGPPHVIVLDGVLRDVEGPVTRRKLPRPVCLTKERVPLRRPLDARLSREERLKGLRTVVPVTLETNPVILDAVRRLNGPLFDMRLLANDLKKGGHGLQEGAIRGHGTVP